MMKTTLITAYAINPYKGSEDGTAWNMTLQIARHQKVIAITRKNNRPDIEQYLKENKLSCRANLQFEYFDLPWILRFWKKKSRGALLYFYLWQIGMVFFIMARGLRFDIAHNLNFHSDWTPSFLWIFGKPFVWGPIGHHPKIPKAYLLENGGKRAFYLDRLKWYTKQFFWHCDPFLKITKWRANKIICINSSVAEVLNLKPEKVVCLPAVATNPPTCLPQNSDAFHILSIGRFVTLKGFDMVVRSFAAFYHWQSPAKQQKIKLSLIGKGPQKAALLQLAKSLNIAHAIDFIEWMDRAKLSEYFATSAVFFFPSHEGAGMVVPEALSYGIPVLCYDNYGPGEFINESCGIKIPYSSYKESEAAFALNLDHLFREEPIRKNLSKGAIEQYQEQFTWERKGQVFSNIYADLLGEKKTNFKPTTITKY